MTGELPGQGKATMGMKRGARVRAAYTLVEVTVVFVIMGVLIGLALPRFSRSLESARADVAGANLRAIWTAERIYWLDNRTYTSDLDLLCSLRLLDPSITSNTYYNYLVTVADSATLTATASAPAVLPGREP